MPDASTPRWMMVLRHLVTWLVSVLLAAPQSIVRLPTMQQAFTTARRTPRPAASTCTSRVNSIQYHSIQKGPRPGAFSILVISLRLKYESTSLRRLWNTTLFQRGGAQGFYRDCQQGGGSKDPD